MCYQNMKYAKAAAFMGALLLTASLQDQAQARETFESMIENHNQDSKGRSTSTLKKRKEDISKKLEGPNLVGPSKSHTSKPKYDWTEKEPQGSLKRHKFQQNSFKEFFSRNIVRPIKDALEDFVDNLKALIKTIKKKIERKIIRPLKNNNNILQPLTDGMEDFVDSTKFYLQKGEKELYRGGVRPFMDEWEDISL